MNFKIYNMDVFEGLKRIELNSVDCVVTSPPYWNLRDYGIEGQIGLEKHPKEYIENLVKVFKEIKKVLKLTGSVWLNMGDVYFGSWGNMSREQTKDYPKGRPPSSFPQDDVWLQPKQKMLMPHRLAIAMQEDGWILRNEIIWHKPSHMPSSVQDRLTNSFEYLFHFVKKKKYYYDLDAIREPHKEVSIQRVKKPFFPNKDHPTVKNEGDMSRFLNPAGKNPADVWSINPEPFSEAHFATFPTGLVRKPLLATCPKEVCKECGKPRERILEPSPEYKKILESQRGTEYYKIAARKEAIRSGNAFGKRASRMNSNYETKGFSDCGCGKGFRAGVVLDPFVGSGTTLLEAQNQGKSGIGIELNPEYIPLINLRLNGDKFQKSLNPNKIEVVSMVMK